MTRQPSPQSTGGCSHCGECCRWLPVADVPECSPRLKQYYRERGLKESGGMFLADAPCRHLKKEKSSGMNPAGWICAIYDKRPATCRNYCGRSLFRGTAYYVPEGCTMAAGIRGK